MPELVLYAAVGIDSHQALELNFGAKPFLFDPSEHLNIFQGSMPVLPVAFTRVHEEAGQAPWGFAEEIEWDDDDGELHLSYENCLVYFMIWDAIAAAE